LKNHSLLFSQEGLQRAAIEESQRVLPLYLFNDYLRTSLSGASYVCLRQDEKFAGYAKL
jgi:hypothetical protein